MKCAVSDFDRTLYVERMISEEDKNAVLNWQKSGNLFVIATGRNFGTDRKVCLLSEKGTSTQKACDGGTITADQLESLDNIVQIHRRNLDLKHIKDLCKDIEERFSEVSAYANLWNGDIVARGVDKAVAVKWLKEHFPQIEKIRCIGDSVNDLGMVRAYQGAVPDVADPEIKKEATQIVKSVAEFLENF